MRFHLVCVKLLQQAGLSSADLRVALKALNSGTNDDDPLLPTMWSIVGKLHLHLAHYQVPTIISFIINYSFLNCLCIIFGNRKLTKLSSAIQTASREPWTPGQHTAGTETNGHSAHFSIFWTQVRAGRNSGAKSSTFGCLIDESVLLISLCLSCSPGKDAQSCCRHARAGNLSINKHIFKIII